MEPILCHTRSTVPTARRAGENRIPLSRRKLVPRAAYLSDFPGKTSLLCWSTRGTKLMLMAPKTSGSRLDNGLLYSRSRKLSSHQVTLCPAYRRAVSLGRQSCHFYDVGCRNRRCALRLGAVGLSCYDVYRSNSNVSYPCSLR